ncbi:MAG: hypothetical protein OQK12_16310, partial [Motiliproteus sp.]|nr:hypothetical protein [Motiliproteus sp.]
MNTALQTTASPYVAPDWQHAVLVVGAGPTGFRFIEAFRRKDQKTPIILFGNEPYLPYDRVKLSSLLAGTDSPDSLALPLEELQQQTNFRYLCSEIQEILTEQNQVLDA